MESSATRRNVKLVNIFFDAALTPRISLLTMPKAFLKSKNKSHENNQVSIAHYLLSSNELGWLNTNDESHIDSNH